MPSYLKSYDWHVRLTLPWKQQFIYIRKRTKTPGPPGPPDSRFQVFLQWVNYCVIWSILKCASHLRNGKKHSTEVTGQLKALLHFPIAVASKGYRMAIGITAKKWYKNTWWWLLLGPASKCIVSCFGPTNMLPKHDQPMPKWYQFVSHQRWLLRLPH